MAFLSTSHFSLPTVPRFYSSSYAYFQSTNNYYYHKKKVPITLQFADTNNDESIMEDEMNNNNNRKDEADDLVYKYSWITDDVARQLRDELLDNMNPLEFDLKYSDIQIVNQDKIHNKRRIDLNDLCDSNINFNSLGLDLSSSSSSEEEEIETIANYAVESTYRWISNFVATLNLCPWAKTSLQTKKAIRMKIIPFYENNNENNEKENNMNFMKDIIRESAIELLHFTGDESIVHDNNNKQISSSLLLDPNAAITFVIAVPFLNLRQDDQEDSRNSMISSKSIDLLLNDSLLPYELSFLPFNNFFIDLEEELFDEADRIHDDEKSNDDEIPIGDLVTIAPFHPSWKFASESNNKSPIDYEKSSPFPTISIVLTEPILNGGGSAITDKIGKHNEEVLTSLGAKKLESMYKNDVLNN